MDLHNQEFKEMVYGLVTDKYRVEASYIKNEFEENSFCSQKYKEIYEANLRLCEKLHVENDPDIECIIDNFCNLSEYLSIKMYDYGIFFATEQLKKEQK